MWKWLKCWLGLHKMTPMLRRVPYDDPLLEETSEIQQCVYCRRKLLVIHCIMEDDIPDDHKCEHGIQFKSCSPCMARGVIG